MIYEKCIVVFNTKSANDMKMNGQKVKVIDYLGNNMYEIEFKNKKRLKVYDTDLIFIPKN